MRFPGHHDFVTIILMRRKIKESEQIKIGEKKVKLLSLRVQRCFFSIKHMHEKPKELLDLPHAYRINFVFGAFSPYIQCATVFSRFWERGGKMWTIHSRRVTDSPDAVVWWRKSERYRTQLHLSQFKRGMRHASFFFSLFYLKHIFPSQVNFISWLILNLGCTCTYHLFAFLGGPKLNHSHFLYSLAKAKCSCTCSKNW